MQNKQKGFTLIELLVVIVILGILSTISVGTFRGYFAKARDAERLSAVMTISKMIQADSAGLGNCGVYNYTHDICATAVLMKKLEELLAENDFSMPTIKNNRTYYYGFKPRTGYYNDFFVAIVSEGDQPQNAKVSVNDNYYLFVDGTSEGIKATLLDDSTSTATCGVLGGILTCHDWAVYEYTESSTSSSWQKVTLP